MTIVRTDYRRKRPPKRKTSPVIPMRIVSAKTPGPDPKKLDASSLSDRHPPAPPAIAEAVSEQKPAQAAAITGPRIVTAKKPRPRSGIGPEQIAAARRDPVPADPPPAARQSAIVTAQSPKSGRFGPIPDFDAEEHRRRGDAAEALFREIVRRARGDGSK